MLNKIIYACILCLFAASNTAAQNITKAFIAGKNPLANYKIEDETLRNDAEALNTRYNSQEERQAAILAFYGKYINSPNLSNTVRSELLEMRSLLHVQNFEYEKSLALDMAILNLRALPKNRFAKILYRYAKNSYIVGRFNMVEGPYQQALQLGAVPLFWDDIRLAEMDVRNDRIGKATARLEKIAIQMSDYGCKMPTKWNEVLSDLQKNDPQRIEDIKNSKGPYLLRTEATSPPYPTVRVPARYPPEAMVRGIGAWVQVAMLLNNDGSVECSFATKSEEGKYAKKFERSAVKSTNKYKYRPADPNNEWPIISEIIVTFSIGNKNDDLPKKRKKSK